jgi:hypothetical protein
MGTEMKIKTLLAGAAIAAAVSLAGAASAQELIQNGGFETGDLTGWSSAGSNVVSGPFGCTVGVTSCVHAGDFGLSFSSFGSESPLTQSVATVAGHTYTISFWLNSIGAMPNSFSLTWDGQVLFSQSDIAADGWVEHTFTGTASSDSTVLTFGLRDDPGFSGLDDISVMDAGGVPEPATWAMMLTGFLGAGAALRSRRRFAVAA